MGDIFYGQWQIDNNIDIEFAEKELLRYLSRAGEGNQKNNMRAKFKVDFITDYGTFKKVELSAVYSQNRAKEDNQFSNATPSGKMEMTITNPDANNFLKPGVKYILTFEEAEHQD